MTTIEIHDSLAAALKLRANQIARRDKSSARVIGTFEDALEVVLRNDKQFDKLFDSMGGAWPDGAKKSEGV